MKWIGSKLGFLADVLLIGGSACLIRGAWIISPALGWIVAGLLLCMSGILMERSGGDSS